MMRLRALIMIEFFNNDWNHQINVIKMIYRQIKLCEWFEHVLYRKTDYMIFFEYNSLRIIIISAIVLSLIHDFRNFQYYVLLYHVTKRKTINLCAICDFKKKFIYFLCEWLNTQHDQRVFFANNLHEHSTFCFSSDQYLLSDNVYINTLYEITFYEVFHTKQFDVRRFNRRHSRVYIDIEHAFDMLKDRWKRLTKLKLRIRDRKNYIFAIKWITACLMFYNIILNIQNNWDKDKNW
jgi:hypothetical protein